MLIPISLQGVSAARRTQASSQSVWDTGPIFRVPRLSQCAGRVAVAGSGCTQLPRSLAGHQRPEMPWGRRGFTGLSGRPRPSPALTRAAEHRRAGANPRGAARRDLRSLTCPYPSFLAAAPRPERTGKPHGGSRRPPPGSAAAPPSAPPAAARPPGPSHPRWRRVSPSMIGSCRRSRAPTRPAWDPP